MPNEAAIVAARASIAAGRLREAADLLATKLRETPASGASAVELVRVLLRMGYPYRAQAVIEASSPLATSPGPALRLAMERTWIGLMRTFDVAAAVCESARLWEGGQASGAAASELADALRVKLRIEQAATIYREITQERSAAAQVELQRAIAQLREAGWQTEAASSALMLAAWRRGQLGHERAYLDLAEDLQRQGEMDMAADALVREADERLKSGADASAIRAPLGEASRIYGQLSHEVGLLDVAHIETKLRIDRYGAVLSELEDIDAAYADLDLPRYRLSVLADLSVHAHQAGDLAAALQWRQRQLEVAEGTGMGMSVVLCQQALAELLMRARRHINAISICEEALKHPMPRVMQGTFEQFLATIYGFAGDREKVRQHRDRARAHYETVGAEDFASILVTTELNEVASSTSDRDLKRSLALAEEWEKRDRARGDYEAAVIKLQMRARLLWQRFRTPGLLQGQSHILDDAREAAHSARLLAADKLAGQARWREIGNCAQLEGQIAQALQDTSRSEQAYRDAISAFNEAGLAMQVANSRYIVGCMRLNASNDAASRGHHEEAVSHFREAEQLFGQALAYYEANGMRSEAARAYGMLAQLYSNGRAIVAASPGSNTADAMRAAALEYLTEAERSLDAIRSEFVAAGAEAAQRGKSEVIAQSRAVYDLAVSILAERETDIDELWTWHQKSRGRALTDVLALNAGGGTSQMLGPDLSRRPDIAALAAREKQVIADLRTAEGTQRSKFRSQLTALRDEMARHPGLKSHLEIRAGQVPSLDNLRSLLTSETERRVVLVDWVHSRGRLGLMATSAEGPAALNWLTLRSDAVAAELARWGNASQFRNQLLGDASLLRPLDPLVAPLEALTRPGDHLILCPSGQLARIPLHALNVGGQPLIARNTINYAPSAAMMRVLMTSRLPVAPAPRQVIAAPTRDLEDSSDFGREIGELLGVTPKLQAESTRGAIITALMSAEIFHYHGHATFDSADPLGSALHLADGRLTARDILALDRGAGIGLATLGACSGGAMQFGIGDEPSGLASALLVRGAHAVCAPLWPVDDREAAVFMQAFYGRLLAGSGPRNIAAALQAAVAELRRSPATANPYVWAPYVLHGDWVLR